MDLAIIHVLKWREECYNLKIPEEYPCEQLDLSYLYLYVKNACLHSVSFLIFLSKTTDQTKRPDGLAIKLTPECLTHLINVGFYSDNDNKQENFVCFLFPPPPSLLLYLSISLPSFLPQFSCLFLLDIVVNVFCSENI